MSRRQLSPRALPSPSIAEAYLDAVIRSWKSRYQYTITFLKQNKRTLSFLTTWSRKPTPHEPLPDIRVDVEFALKYNRDDQNFSSPKITFRVEEQDYIQDNVENIDTMILGVMKLKQTFFRSNPLKLELAKQFFDSRFLYEPVPEDYPTKEDFKPMKRFVAVQGRELELELIHGFKKADTDNDGFLNQNEVTKWLLERKVNFTTDEAELILKEHDEDKDSMLSFKEYLPIALALNQALHARNNAEERMRKAEEERQSSATIRIKSSKGLHTSIEIDLSDLDVEQRGVIPWTQMRTFLTTLDLDLAGGEIDECMKRLNTVIGEEDEKLVEYQEFQMNYEYVIKKSIQAYANERATLDVERTCREEIFNNPKAHSSAHSGAAVAAADGAEHKNTRASSGAMNVAAIMETLKAQTVLPLNLVQVHVVFGNRQLNDNVPIRNASRKVAMVMEVLRHAESIACYSDIINRSRIEPIELLRADQKANIDAQLVQKFSEFDTHNTGLLNRDDFHKCLADTSLKFSAERVESLRVNADLNRDDLIDLTEFKKFGYKHLLPLMRESVLDKSPVNFNVVDAKRQAELLAADDGEQKAAE
jgi:Ca2+-binding EF-hand superfamily protein